MKTHQDIQTEIDSLLTQARRMQREQFLLINARRNATRFGRLERQLDQTWTRIGQLRHDLRQTPRVPHVQRVRQRKMAAYGRILAGQLATYAVELGR